VLGFAGHKVILDDGEEFEGEMGEDEDSGKDIQQGLSLQSLSMIHHGKSGECPTGSE
jgi:hypothetical protein